MHSLERINPTLNWLLNNQRISPNAPCEWVTSVKGGMKEEEVKRRLTTDWNEPFVAFSSSAAGGAGTHTHEGG